MSLHIIIFQMKIDYLSLSRIKELNPNLIIYIERFNLAPTTTGREFDYLSQYNGKADF